MIFHLSGRRSRILNIQVYDVTVVAKRTLADNNDNPRVYDVTSINIEVVLLERVIGLLW